jgi:formylglycine-generating enzyme required for sulfatase activity
VEGAGNACDAQPQGCFGAVASVFQIARSEVTNAQYTEFLNAVAKADPNGLYHPTMASSGAGHGGITRSGSAGSYSYDAAAGRENLPVNYVSFYDALRFANWLHNGQPVGAQGPATHRVGRVRDHRAGDRGQLDRGSPNAIFALASEDEWYKAAYYDVASASYFAYPARSNTASTCASPGATANTANCGAAGGTPGVGNLTAAGSYPGAIGPNGTVDQGGNVWEWNEAIVDGTSRGLRGGSFNVKAANLAAATRSNTVRTRRAASWAFASCARCPSRRRRDAIRRRARPRGSAPDPRARDRRRGAPAVAPVRAPAAADDPTQTLLGSQRGGSFGWDYCAGKPDATPLPPTRARSRSPAPTPPRRSTSTRSGELPRESERGPGGRRRPRPAASCARDTATARRYSIPEATVLAGLFTGTDANSNGSTSTFSADQYNQVWMIWGGYTQRPANFDELAAERYGSAFSSSPNPYPLPGEDPNLTNGGSGRLPELFTQLRSSDGSWSGEITVTCHGCHSGEVGSGTYGGGDGPGVIWGGGSSLADLNLFLRDFLALGYEASVATVLNLNHTRGRNNASLINLAFAAAGGTGSGPNIAGVITSGSTADMDTPAWWNMGHRPGEVRRRRVPDGLAARRRGLLRADDRHHAAGSGVDARERPRPERVGRVAEVARVPFPIDTSLAEQGAELFHTLDLWAPERNNPVRRPEGNGSCASCTAPTRRVMSTTRRSSTRPSSRASPRTSSPLDIIGTDPERLLANNDSVQSAGRDSFFGYPQTKNTAQDCGPQNGPAVKPAGRENGYLAPPLYGVWATAPYLHNGSVPNLWELLKPSERKRIWRRASKPAYAQPLPNLLGNAIMGYDTDLARAYDSDKVGWRYDEIACQVENATNPSVSPYVNCTPSDADQQDPLAEQILAQLYSNVLLAWNIFFPPPLTPAQMEDRKIFNTWMFAQGNEGHDFNAVLSDDERRAIIEYLKTL